MTELERFKKFFDKYGVKYEVGEWFGFKEKQFIDVLGTSFEFKNKIFTHLYEPEFDTKIERLPDGK